MSEVLQELRRRKKGLDTLAGFRDFMHSSGHIDFQFAHEKHHQIMANAFERVMNGELKRLIIQMPPASAKSTLCIQFVLWWLAKNPHDHVLRVSATQSLSERFARRCRSAIQEKEFDLLTGATLSATEQSVANFSTTKGGGITSAGVGTSIIGLRSNLNILDDPIASWEQAHSEGQRNQMVDWYFSEYRSRLVPGAPEIIVSTRWHHDDICGHILRSEEADTWEVIRIPMECDSFDDPLGRKPGERLWPEWFNDQMVIEAKRDPERWSGMYQQQPLNAEGDFFAIEDFEIVDMAPDGLELYAGLDLAMTEKQSADATATVIGGMYENVLYIVDVREDRVTPDKTIQNLLDLNDAYNFQEVLIEDSPAEKVFRDLCHKIFRSQNTILPLMPMPTRGRDKSARLQALRGLAKMNSVKIVRGNWNADFLRSMTEFPFGKHDDIPDAAGLLGRRAAKMVNTQTPRSAKPPEPMQTQVAVREGMMYLTESLDELFESNETKPTGILRL